MRKEQSLKKNFIMNCILTCSKYIFPLITFPYVSRILLADGNGRINFASSVVEYFIMFAMLGIPYYGVRACAIVRDNKEKLSQVVHELFCINCITCIIAYILLFCVTGIVPKLSDYRSLILIFSVLILCNLLSVEWLYTALEEYSYITNRTLIFKTIALILTFLLVKDANDYSIYAVIMVFGMGASCLLNLMRLPNYIYIQPQKKLNISQHFAPILSFFMLSVSWTIYANLDVVMLGFLSGDTEVGYYSATLKLKSILISTVSALGAVLLPRLTKYSSEKQMEKFHQLLRKDSSFIQIVAVSLIGYVFVNATQIIMFLSGESYLAAVSVLRIMVFSILFIGLSTMTGTNVLVPIGREKITIIATVIGIVIDVILNIIFIPCYGAAGAAFATVIGEISILTYECVFLRKTMKNIFDIKCTLKVIIGAGIATLVVYFVQLRITQLNILLYLVITFILYYFVYMIILVVLKETFIIEQFSTILRKINAQSRWCKGKRNC